MAFKLGYDISTPPENTFALKNKCVPYTESDLDNVSKLLVVSSRRPVIHQTALEPHFCKHLKGNF